VPDSPGALLPLPGGTAHVRTAPRHGCEADLGPEIRQLDGRLKLLNAGFLACQQCHPCECCDAAKLEHIMLR
jgi:hypothetical protein